MSDIEGVSTFRTGFAVTTGKQITVKAPAAKVYDVSFFFGRLVQDGIWQLDEQAAAAQRERPLHRLRQAAGGLQAGRSTVTFTDPHYWAAKTGQFYSIDLSKGVPKDLAAHAEHASRRSALRADRQRFSRLRARRVPRATLRKRRRGIRGTHA